MHPTRHIFGHTPFGHTFFEADNGANGSGDNSQSPTQTPPTQTPNSGSESDVQKLANAILASQRVGGEPTKAIEVMAGQILAKDTRIADLQKQTLSDADRALFQSASELLKSTGLKDFAEVRARLDNESTLSQREQQRQQDAELSKVAAALKLKGNPLFLSLARGTEFEVSGDGDGQRVSVKVDDKTMSFNDFVQLPQNELWRDALPALQEKPELQGTPWPAQNSGRDIVPVTNEQATRLEVHKRHNLRM